MNILFLKKKKNLRFLYQVHGYKFDPEGEYVRHWLPELARVPAEWIHHPWDAPPNLLRAAGVELGVNYPKPIVDIDSAREYLTKAVSMMWTSQPAFRASNENGTTEVVMDNLDNRTKDSWIPRVIIRENVPRTTSPSHDQRVPSIQNLKNNSSERKRSRCLEEERSSHKNLHTDDCEPETSKTDKDLCSTAESSSVKKHCSGENHFYAPPMSSSSNHKPSSGYEYPDLTQPRHG
ncbi:hypothetical protein GIB67_026878 [Kingdonia uniflora]|uniref:Cryptochrome/DNA photolyase FAD-binding domain-containing protein n=1 Tax=Kingdonia uniflora TaxID=39325 RepID=A0A7J7M7T8_9MAGN|nr:hypothetical protein GIB67_026878 [Kingdonia uniflora]